MWNEDLSELTYVDVRQLVEDGIEESSTREYKQQLPGNGDDEKREFLYDVAAFANSSGGVLLFGVAEKRDSENRPTSIAGEITGIISTNPSSEMTRLENMVRDGIAPRLTGLITKLVEGENGSVLVLKIPKSWNAPHMVIYKQVNKFYGRVSSGKYLMSVDELRRSFSQGTELRDAIGRWRRHRVELIRSDQGPVALQVAPTWILHVIPASAFVLPSISSSWRLSEKLRIEMRCASTELPGVGRYNGDGFLRRADTQLTRTTGYTQVFRSGIIEYVSAQFSWDLEGNSGPQTDVYTDLLERELVYGYYDAVKTYDELQLTAPIYLGVSIFGLSGRRMYLGTRSYRQLDIMRDDSFESPEVLVDREAPLDSLKILADLMWQAGGLETTPSVFNGKWEPLKKR